MKKRAKAKSPKEVSAKQLAANRRNARKSTGPRTTRGKSVSRMNAMKHGILSLEVVAHGGEHLEGVEEFEELHNRFFAELEPEGPVEEMLVDQIVTAHWRLRRALIAEAAEMELGAGNAEDKRYSALRMEMEQLRWQMASHPVPAMCESMMGIALLISWLKDLREEVQRTGTLTDDSVAVICHGRANALSRTLLELRDAEVVSGETLGGFLERKIADFERMKEDVGYREVAKDMARVRAASLPAADVLEKIGRYETKLQRSIYKALAQLERLQRARRGEVLPLPGVMPL